MNRHPKWQRKPDPMFLIAVFVVISALLTSIAQAAGVKDVLTGWFIQDEGAEKSRSYRFKDLDLSAKFNQWKPQLLMSVDDDGLRLVRPLGAEGPVVRFSTSLPQRTENTRRASGDHRIGTLESDTPEAYLFIRKRW